MIGCTNWGTHSQSQSDMICCEFSKIRQLQFTVVIQPIKTKEKNTRVL